jgi:peptidoglycan/xylan/chitin deacetylase (PgdA/CDA1 family)
MWLLQIALFFFPLSALSACSHKHQIAVTFDDLPGPTEAPAKTQDWINRSILEALKKSKAPATGFVNEGKLFSHGETEAKIAILDLWARGGFLLGNHTYSHHSLSGTDLKIFQEDVEKGSLISKALMDKASLPYEYFRHPYLHTGMSEDKRTAFETFLKKHGYQIAPVTIDTDDWKFNKELEDHPEKKELILKKYLDHTRKKFTFYKKASEKIFGRNIKHTWLLHANRLNAYAMADLLSFLDEEHYEVIPLGDAMKDGAYSEKDSYYGAFGVSWLYRWDFTRGKVVDWSEDPEPDNNP